MYRTKEHVDECKKNSFYLRNLGSTSNDTCLTKECEKKLILTKNKLDEEEKKFACI